MEVNELEKLITEHFMQTLGHNDESSLKSEDFKHFLDSVLNRYQLELFKREAVSEEYQQCNTLMHSSLHAYQNTYNSLEAITLNNNHIIERIDDNDEIPVSDLEQQLNHFHDQISHELVRANEKIAELKRQVADLEKTTNVDNLTKVYNRKAMKEYCDDMILRAEKMGGSLDLFALFIDIDDFKHINDTHGHLAGDKVLIYLGKTLKRIVRESDRVFRFGGEEFVIMLNRYSDENAQRAAERIRSTIEKSHLIYKSSQINITVSMGLSQHKAGDSVESFIERTDAALLKAKDAGKNRIVVGE